MFYLTIFLNHCMFKLHPKYLVYTAVRMYVTCIQVACVHVSFAQHVHIYTIDYIRMHEHTQSCVCVCMQISKGNIHYPFLLQEGNVHSESATM